MQSNNTEREELLLDIRQCITATTDCPGPHVVKFSDKPELRGVDLAVERLERLILAREHRKTLEARIDELEQVWAQTKPAVPINTWIFYRLEDLKSQLPKDKGEESL